VPQMRSTDCSRRRGRWPGVSLPRVRRNS
jgi:hypothetical protein